LIGRYVVEEVVFLKPYVKPVFEKVDLMPNERLTRSSCNEKFLYCDKNGNKKYDEGEPYTYYQW